MRHSHKSVKLIDLIQHLENVAYLTYLPNTKVL